MSSQQAALSRRQASWLWWAAVVGLCLVLLAPLLIVDVPPMGDYPNHLARAFVLSALPDDAVLAKFYAPNWSIIPNLAIDLLAPSMMHVLPVHVVGRLIIAVSLLLPVLGTIAYNTAFGGRWWPLCVGLIAYNSCLLYGFLNFSLGLGLALLLASTWVRWREPYPARTIIVALAGTPIIFACHLMGLVFYATLAFPSSDSKANGSRRTGVRVTDGSLRNLGAAKSWRRRGLSAARSEAAAACHHIRQL
jgi:hypothetical protein